MTMTAERPRYAGVRRFNARPAEVRRPRHRSTETLAVALVAQLVEVVLGAGRAAAPLGRALAGLFASAWARRMTVRAAAVLALASLALALTLAVSAVALVEPSRATRYAPVVTPSPTPYPSGWTFEPR
jgi:hypothetical protein